MRLNNAESIDFVLPIVPAEKYYIHYRCQNRQGWIPNVVHIQSNAGGGRPGDGAIVTPYNIYNNGQVDSEKDEYRNDSHSFIEINGKVYVKPSMNFLESKKMSTDSNYLTRNFAEEFTEKYLSFDQLFDEFYDYQNEILTNMSLNYEAGDTIYFRDEILEINYNSLDDVTIFKFKSNGAILDYHEVAFKGDQTNEYTVGDQLELKYNLLAIEETDLFVFVDLDYNICFEKTGEVPEIDDFLINKTDSFKR